MLEDAFHTKTKLEAMLNASGLAPNKRFGQNFLIDRNLMQRLIDTAMVGPDDLVLEVGPGTGSMTGLLAQSAGGVIAVEIDRGMAKLVTQNVVESSDGKVELINESVLASKSCIAPAVMDAIERRRAMLTGRVMMVANLPYDIASPLVIELAIGCPWISPLCFTVQREVGDRMIAQPGDSAFGPMSILLQGVADIRRIAIVPHQAFWPQPKVESAMVRLDSSFDRRNAVGDVERFRTTVRTLFAHRRKTLRQNLKMGYPAHDRDRIADVTAIDLNRRPETLILDEWITMAHALV